MSETTKKRVCLTRAVVTCGYPHELEIEVWSDNFVISQPVRSSQPNPPKRLVITRKQADMIREIQQAMARYLGQGAE